MLADFNIFLTNLSCSLNFFSEILLSGLSETYFLNFLESSPSKIGEFIFVNLFQIDKGYLFIAIMFKHAKLKYLVTTIRQLTAL